MNHEQEIVRSVLKLSDSKEILVIGIDGLGGAGKSTISERICAELESSHRSAVLLHIDDFINTREVRYNPVYPEWQCYYELQWRYDYFIEIIGQLKKMTEGSVAIELYDKDHDCYVKKRYAVKPNTIVIVEGIFLQRKELQGVFDYMVYIDIPEDVRMERVLKRDIYIGDAQQIRNKYENRYFPAERSYVHVFHPKQTADFVIS